ncbi:hypothetical protein KKA14_20585 [bacterium]|nr:hypothetical protein [bacterium]
MFKSTIKKVITTSTIILGLSTGAFAEEKAKVPIDLLISGDLEAVFKTQTDYRSIFDSRDSIGASGNDYRDGSNNRSSQNVRTKGGLTMVALGGENKMDGGDKWYNLIGVIRLSMAPDDPDYEDGESLDGAMADDISLGEFWLRYSPALPVGIKIGSQTVEATAVAAGIGHQFRGDLDDDFIFYTAGVLQEKPGITIDLHLSQDIEFGIGQLQGMGDLSAVTSQGSSEQATNTVVWFKGKVSMVDLMLGYQSIAVGGSETDSEGIIGKYKHEYAHTVVNWSAKVNLGSFSPFMAMQTVAGEKISDDADVATYDTNMEALAAAGATRLNLRGGERGFEFSTTTVGLLANLKEYGKLAFEYTLVSTPEWGATNNVAIASELSNTMQINYEYPLFDGASITLFYAAMTPKEDSKLRSDIATTVANETAIDTAVTAAFITSAQGDALKEGGAGIRAFADASKITPTTSMGVSFKMTFGD